MDNLEKESREELVNIKSYIDAILELEELEIIILIPKGEVDREKVEAIADKEKLYKGEKYKWCKLIDSKQEDERFIFTYREGLE